MRTVLVVSLLALAAAACGSRLPVQCKTSSDCNEPGLAGGSCDVNPATGNLWCSYTDPACPSGQRWASVDTGDGLAGLCENTEPDAGLPIDAGVDAQIVPDGKPGGPIVTNDQPADLVLGQPDFSTATENTGGVSAKSLDYPNGITSDGSSLWVVDSGNARALRWSPVPASSYASANLVLGKNTFTDGADPIGISASNIGRTCCGPSVAIAGTKLVVSDTYRNRVLIWSTLPTMNGQAATLVLGQSDASSSGNGSSASQLYRPYGVWTDGARLAVADAVNNRVLIWTTFPSTNGQAANVVLGQTGFGMSNPGVSPTASNMNGPTGVFFDGTRFYVTDTNFNRVLVWNSFPTTNGQAADFAIGEPNLTSATGGVAAGYVKAPQAVAVVGAALFVADTLNDRVLVFTPLPTSSGPSASYVLGKTDFTTPGGTNVPPTQTNLDGPVALTVVGSSLYVTDGNHQRVVRYGLNLP